MMNFPSFCVDNFYPNVDAIREFALKQTFVDTPGNYPGKRTDGLHLLDKDLFDAFCNKLFSVFYDYNNCQVQWKVETSFQLIEPYSDDKDNIKNSGWIHKDGEAGVFAGVIYLSKDSDLQTGTSLFRLKDTNNLDKIMNSDTKFKFYSNGTDDNYDEELKQHNASFEETVRYNNVYNRLIAFDGEDWHGVNSFYNSSKEPRLTQVFFVKELNSDSNPPLKRYGINPNYIP